MNILVTGGAGFIGTNLCRILLQKGHRVSALDNFVTGHQNNLNLLKKYPRFKFFKHDITKVLPKLLYLKRHPLDVIYHLACPTGVPNLTRLSEEMLLTCSLGTRNILELARHFNAKFLLTSSSEVYGNPKVTPQAESYTGNVDPTGPRSPYEEGKRFAESLVVTYFRKYRLNVKIVRVFNTYGLHMNPADTRVIPRFLHQVVAGKPLTVQGNGRQTRTFCYVDDLVNGLLLVMKKGKDGEVYNIGGRNRITIFDLARLMIKITQSSSKINFVRRPTHDHESRLPKLAKINALGWKPQVPLATGLHLILKKP